MRAKTRRRRQIGRRYEDAYEAYQKTGDLYEKNIAKGREYRARRIAQAAASYRDVGPLPEIANTRRRKRCERNFAKFCRTYLTELFPMRFSDDHKKMIELIETAVLEGDKFTFAMPRGSGKTTLCEAAVLWAALYRHRVCPILVRATVAFAKQSLEALKSELECNDLLLEDFPEACYPIRALERIVHRATGQTLDGWPTYIGWTAERVILPTIEGRPGAVILVDGLTAGIRGTKVARPDGASVRPDLALLDDPQTRESAASADQCQKREDIILGDVMGLAGPGKTIAALMPCTIIYEDDLAARFLDRDVRPDWHGRKTSLVVEFPTNEKLWEEYRGVRERAMRADEGQEPANEFYRAHRGELDEGAEVSWPERKLPGEISAIQHAMNLKFDSPVTFEAEYQNEPASRVEGPAEDRFDSAEIMKKINGYAPCRVPRQVAKIVSFIDVQKTLLYYVTCAFEQDFTGYVVDYGTRPDQNRFYWTLAEANPTMAGLVRGKLEAQIRKTLGDLCDTLVNKYRREDGAPVSTDRILVDANWGETTKTIYEYCAQTKLPVVPAHGRGVQASSLPFSEYQKKRGDVVGNNWRSPFRAGEVRHVAFDANHWKSFLLRRFNTLIGDAGCLSLFNPESFTTMHRVIGDHCAAEYGVQTEGRNRRLVEWKLRPERPDNHFLDCLVGCMVAGSYEGVSLPEESGRPRGPKIKCSELWMKKRMER